MNARSELARALGRAETGGRATATVPGSQLAGCLDLLRQAAARLLPVLVRAPLDDGHAGYHAAADSGAVLLFARTPEEAPALELVARLLAERALLPVVLASETAPETGPSDLKRIARKVLGLPEDKVRPFTPAQEMLFGRYRRRVPRWFDLARPVLRGAEGDAGLRGQRRAGFAPLIVAAVPELLAAAIAEVEAACGRELGPLALSGTDKARVLVLAQGEAAHAVEALSRDKTRPRIGSIGLRCLRPLSEELRDALRGQRPVIVLERADAPLAGGAPLLREVRAMMLALRDKERPPLHSALFGLGGAPLRNEDLLAFCQEVAGKAPRELVYLGTDFAPTHSQFPKRQVLHEQLRRAHPGIAELGLRVPEPEAAGDAPEPAHRRAPPRQDPTHDSPTRFWDVIGAPLIGGEPPSPDPYLVAGSVPALTSLYHAAEAGNEMPIWEPSLCTGCGRCWTACPDGAVLPAVLDPAALLESGLRRAKAAGHAVDALRMLAGKLGKAIPKAVIEGTPRTAGDALRAAAAPILDKLGGGPRRSELEQACQSVAAGLDPVTLAVTEPFFGGPDAESAAGELLVLAIDPDACKGCGACITECEPEALAPIPRTADREHAGRAAARLWQELPDTAGATIARVRKQPEPGTAAAQSLSRHCLHALAPGDLAEPGSGSKVALRQVLATCEAALQPLLQQHLADLGELQERFGEVIRESLSSALPTSDLDALAEGLSTLTSSDVDLGTLANRLQDVTDTGRVDSGKLAVLVETARALADLMWRIDEGVTGLGRARAGLTVAPDREIDWAAAFPWNPFAAPVALDRSGEAGNRAIGLLEGQLAALCEDFALLRRARALVDGKPPGPRSLTWGQLTEDERALCPPLLLVGGSELGRDGLAQVSALLGNPLPVKVVLLADLGLQTVADLGLLALAHRSAFVVQSSVAFPDHLVEGTLRALRHPGPALLHVHAPSPKQHGFDPGDVVLQARRAVQCGAFPLFTYDPLAEGVFGLRLHLEGDGPQPDANQAPRTPAHWAATEARYAEHFAPLTERASRPTPLPEYLELPEAERAGRTPCIECDGIELVVDEVMTRFSSERLHALATLREWAGAATPFTERVREQAEAAVAAERAAELARIHEEHDRKLGELRARVEHEMVQRLQRKLTSLAGGRHPAGGRN